MNRTTLLYIAVVVTTLTYIIWRALFTIPLELGILNCIFGLLLFFSETLGAIETIQHCYGMGEELVPELPKIKDEDYPDIDVFIATYNEPCELLYKTVNGCLYMEYPDKSKVHIYLLDDGNRQEVQELAQRMGVGYITREEHLHAKAGNLNNALQHTHSPLVATFDADMIPLSDFLLKTVLKLDLSNLHNAFIILIYFNIIFFQNRMFRMNKIIFIAMFNLLEIKQTQQFMVDQILSFQELH